MQNVAPREDLVLVSSRKMLEAADLADFAKSRSLGEVIVESDTERAYRLLSERRFSFAFIGLPDTERRGRLLSALAAKHTHIVLVDDSGATPGSVGMRVLSRPFTDSDLEGALRDEDDTSDHDSAMRHSQPAA
ncbi:hypothetical protein ACSQ76_06320 [Roseovarius sp. B08]|uniref:hypothetical protein n=1 Tax=Roseovarius sp. B08 TaxID=3449223 RepID=UPI003EDB6D0F